MITSCQRGAVAAAISGSGPLFPAEYQGYSGCQSWESGRNLLSVAENERSVRSELSFFSNHASALHSSTRKHTTKVSGGSAKQLEAAQDRSNVVLFYAPLANLRIQLGLPRQVARERWHSLSENAGLSPDQHGDQRRLGGVILQQVPLKLFGVPKPRSMQFGGPGNRPTLISGSI
jgi:hypothetical protein